MPISSLFGGLLLLSAPGVQASPAWLREPWLWFYDYVSDYRSPVVLYEVTGGEKPERTAMQATHPTQPFVQWLASVGTLEVAAEGWFSEEARRAPKRGVTSPDGKSVAIPSVEFAERADAVVVRVQSAGKSEALRLGALWGLGLKVKPSGEDVSHVAWSPRGTKLAVCVTGTRSRDRAETCPEYLTYVWDLGSNRVRFIGPGFKAVWQSEDRLALTGYTNNLPAKFGHDLSQRPLPMFSATYTVAGRRLSLVEDTMVSAYSPSRRVFVGFVASRNGVRLRKIGTDLRPLPGWHYKTKNIQWNSELFYQYGITAR